MHANLPTTELLPAPFCAKPDIVRRFLAWVQTADADARAQGASALARAYLYSDLPASVRAEAVLAMTVLLDDPSVCVRRSLAEALCRAHDAPRGVVLALAADEPEAAAPVLQHSPVLTDADLVDCVASGDVVTQMALARRPNLPPRAKAALAETGHFDAVRALIANVEIDLPAELLQRIFARFGDDASLRDALLERPALPAALRARIVVAAAKDLAVEASQWMSPLRAERVAREARDQAICTIASSCRPDERAELTRALRAAGALTPALLLRSLLGGERTLFSQTLAELSGLPLPRVAAFILEPQGEGFAALARRAGLKAGVLLAFRAALAAIKAQAAEGWRQSQTAAGAKGHRRLRAARRSGARQGSGAAVALRRRSGKGGSSTLRPRGGGFGLDRSAAAPPGIFARQRRFRSRAEADRGLWLASDRRGDAGACGAVGKFGRG